MFQLITAVLTLVNTIVSGISKHIRKKDEKEIRDNPFKSWNTCFGVHVENSTTTKTNTGEQQDRGRDIKDSEK